MKKRPNKIYFSKFNMTSKNVFWWFIKSSLVLILISYLIFWWRVGEIPALSVAKRKEQIIKSYFSIKSPIVIKTAHVRPASDSDSLIVFQRDKFFNAVFAKVGLEGDFSSEKNIEKNLDKFMDYMDKVGEEKSDSRILIFDSSDLGIFTPLLSFFMPVIKTLEIEGPEGYRLWGVDLLDLDNCGTKELICYWFDYAGGSGGTFLPMVVKIKNDNLKVCHFPLIEKNKNGFEEVPPEETEIKINGKKSKFFLTPIHSDNYWIFKDIDGSKKLKLIFAYTLGDDDYHYGAQSWEVAFLDYRDGEFEQDELLPTFLIPKTAGVKLGDMHGYLEIPIMGQLWDNWQNSWLDVETQDQSFYEMRSRSIVFKKIEKIQKAVKKPFEDRFK